MLSVSTNSGPTLITNIRPTPVDCLRDLRINERSGPANDFMPAKVMPRAVDSGTLKVHFFEPVASRTERTYAQNAHFTAWA